MIFILSILASEYTVKFLRANPTKEEELNLELLFLISSLLTFSYSKPKSKEMKKYNINRPFYPLHNTIMLQFFFFFLDFPK